MSHNDLLKSTFFFFFLESSIHSIYASTDC